MTAPTLYYLRHGLTDWNSKGRLQGQRDTPLNAQGRVDAVTCAGLLRDLLVRDARTPMDVDYISSPLVRATETLGIIRQAFGLPREDFARDARLMEISFGAWEGLTYQDVLARDPNVVTHRETSKWLFRPPGGESYEELAVRVAAWHTTLTRAAIVCAHGGTGRALVAVRGVAPPKSAAHHPIEHGVIYRFEGHHVAKFSRTADGEMVAGPASA